MQITTEISAELRSFRKRHRFTLQEIARESGLGEPKVSRLETGWTPVTESVVLALKLAYEKLGIIDPAFFQKIANKLSKDKNSPCHLMSG